MRYQYTPTRKTQRKWRLVSTWSIQNFHTLLMEMKNSTCTLENTLAVQHKVKHELIIKPSNLTPRYLSKRNENMPT